MANLRQISGSGGELRFELTGRLDADSLPGVWPAALAAVRAAGDRPVVLDAKGVDYCDGAGIAFLVDLLRQPRPAAAPVEVRELAPRYRILLDQFEPEAFARRPGPPPRRAGALERIGRAAAALGADSKSYLAYLGEVCAALAAAARRPRQVRWRDVWGIAEQAGANALPVVALIAFLMGVILAFQSAIPMRQFGAEIFVADLVGLALLRELGPLMTAILMAGRSGAAFAAEIGTMKVNEEIDALTTMGLDPVRFLVVTRILATLAVIPLLTVFADLVGLAGGCLVMLTFGIPAATYIHEVVSIVGIGDFLGGLAKSVAFGLLIAGIGGLRGLQTRSGPSAVGISTTRAVVTAIIWIVIADGVFAVVYNRLGI